MKFDCGECDDKVDKYDEDDPVNAVIVGRYTEAVHIIHIRLFDWFWEL